jgi:hypothetical protein
MKRIIFLFFFICTTHMTFSTNSRWEEELNALSIQERATLESFFRILCSKSQAGYVIWGNKPICEEGIIDEETSPLMLGNPSHRMSIYLKAGWKVWNKLSCSKSTKNLFIVRYDRPSHDWIHFAVINKKAFLEIVSQNLPLFQHALGPDVSPSFLFRKLLDPSLNFIEDTLHNDGVLTGIVLGFGTQNALKGSRSESISQYLMLEASPPFKSTIARGNKYQNLPLTINQQQLNFLKPSLGYSSLEKELADLDKQHKITVDLYPDATPPLPWFGCWPNPETEKLLSHYRMVQPNICAALKSQNFLKIVLAKFFEEEVP